MNPTTLPNLATLAASARSLRTHCETDQIDYVAANTDLVAILAFQANLQASKMKDNLLVKEAAILTRLLNTCRQQELKTLHFHLAQDKLDHQIAKCQPSAPTERTARQAYQEADQEEEFIPMIDPLPRSSSLSPQALNPQSQFKNQKSKMEESPSSVTSPPPSNPTPASNSGSGDANAANPSPSLPGPSIASSNSPAAPSSSSPTPTTTAQNSTASAPHSATTSDSPNHGKIRVAASRAAKAEGSSTKDSATNPSKSQLVPGLEGVTWETFDKLVDKKYEVMKEFGQTRRDCTGIVHRQLKHDQKIAAQEKAKS